MPKQPDAKSCLVPEPRSPVPDTRTVADSPELSAEQMLECDDKPMEKLEIPEWGGHVFVTTMTARQRDRIANISGEDEYSDAARALVACYCVCDKNRVLKFKPYHVTALCERSTVPLQRIWDVARRLNGLDRTSVEEMAKNSETAPAGSSSTD